MRAILQAVRTAASRRSRSATIFWRSRPMHNCVPRVFWAAALAAALVLDAGAAKQTVKIAYIGPLTGGVSANGIGGRNTAHHAGRPREADPPAKNPLEPGRPEEKTQPNNPRHGTHQ